MAVNDDTKASLWKDVEYLPRSPARLLWSTDAASQPQLPFTVAQLEEWITHGFEKDQGMVKPVASGYFGSTPLGKGQFAIVGQMGDGRCMTILKTYGLEVQLKGAGKTPWTEHPKDGKATLSELVREIAAARALSIADVPTSQTLHLFGLVGEQVVRKKPFQPATRESAGIALRAAPSFVRVGHFEFLAHHLAVETMQSLVSVLYDVLIREPNQLLWPQIHTHSRRLEVCTLKAKALTKPKLCEEVLSHRGERVCTAEGKTLTFFRESVVRTARLAAFWDRLGFVHGMLRTDNVNVLGIALDLGSFSLARELSPSLPSSSQDVLGCQHLSEPTFDEGVSHSMYSFKFQAACLGECMGRLAGCLGLIADPQGLQEVLDAFWPAFFWFRENPEHSTAGDCQACINVVTTHACRRSLADDVLGDFMGEISPH